MNVVHVNTTLNGGAAIACKRIVNALKGNDLRVDLLTEGNISSASISDRIRRKLQHRFLKRSLKEYQNHRDPNLEMASSPFGNPGLAQTLESADIVHLHWVSGLLDYPTFFQRIGNKPVIWTLHDMNPFLGLEHYMENTPHLDSGGEEKHRVYSPQERDLFKLAWGVKRQALEQSTPHLHIVTPSDWLKKESLKNGLFKKFPHHVVRNGFPLEIFKALDKAKCRHVLSLPEKSKIILFVAGNLDRYRKGFSYLKGAIDHLQLKDQFTLCTVGRFESLSISNHIDLGSVSDDRLMAIIYSAADLFVIPSLEDNLPNTMIESLLCGTPIVGFPTGGIKEVINERRGIIANEMSAVGLKNAIESFFSRQDDFDNELLSEEAGVEFGARRTAEEYYELYKCLAKK